MCEPQSRVGVVTIDGEIMRNDWVVMQVREVAVHTTGGGVDIEVVAGVVAAAVGDVKSARVTTPELKSSERVDCGRGQGSMSSGSGRALALYSALTGRNYTAPSAYHGVALEDKYELFVAAPWIDILPLEDVELL